MTEFIHDQGNVLLLNRIQCIRDFVNSLIAKAEGLQDRRSICCSGLASIIDEDNEVVLDEDELNINF